MQLAVLLTLAVAVPADLPQQIPDVSQAVPESLSIVPGPQYAAGWLHTLLFGRHYRDLWNTPVTVEVLNLSTYAGGLSLLRRGGGRQTKSLRFEGADGRQYVFRSVDKDPSLALPPELRETLVDEILQDQISSGHPAGGLVVAPLLDACEVLHATPKLFVMPDDARLGDHRDEFAGMFGTMEMRPEEGAEGILFAGSGEVVGSEELFERLERGPHDRLDSRAYLAARLLDMYLGDWDRHQDQWRWARYGDGPFVWRPIPRDRDQAFSRLDGFLIWIARSRQPELVGFAEKYPNIQGLTWTARFLDRRLLSDLARSIWDSTAAVLQTRLTDSVIEHAVVHLPPEFHRVNGEELTRALKARRDRLRDVALEFYSLLAHQVDVHATDEAELLEVRRVDDRFVDVRIGLREDPSNQPFFSRRFDRRETQEIRVYLHGGDDRAIVRGNVKQSILVRVIGGGSDDQLLDSSRVRAGHGFTRLYDSRGENQFVATRGTVVDRHRAPDLAVAEEFSPPTWSGLTPPPPDWGSRLLPTPWTTYDPDIGLFIGGGLVRYKYGFRKLPYEHRIRLRAGYATEEQTGRVDVEIDIPDALRGVRAFTHVRASGIDIIRFYGFGNESSGERANEFYDVRQQQLLVAPGVAIPGKGWFSLSLTPVFKIARTRLRAGTLIDSLRPYGIDTFGQFGLGIGTTLDTRDRAGAPTRGFYVRAIATGYPAAMSVAEPFARLEGEASAYWSPSMAGDPTVALRVGGQKVWGDYPFHEAAYLGGAGSLRGFSEQRFAGDASLYGSAELRLYLTKFVIGLPGDFGVFGLTDVGRVFLSGEASDRWHHAYGGGVWFSFLDRANTMSIALAASREGQGVYIKAGFPF